jgi:hypothetical protein
MHRIEAVSIGAWIAARGADAERFARWYEQAVREMEGLDLLPAAPTRRRLEASRAMIEG